MKTTKLWLALALSVILGVILVGCASTSSIPRLTIQFPVKVSDHVVYLSKPNIIDRTTLLYGSDHEKVKSRDREFDEYFGDLKDKVATTVFENFDAGLRKHPVYAKFVAPEARHVFHLEIVGAGLVLKNTFSSYYKPNIAIRVHLKDDNGNILLTEHERITTFSDRTPEYTLEEYLTDRNKLFDAFIKATIAVVADVLKEI